MPVLHLTPDQHLEEWPSKGKIGILDLEYTAWDGSAKRGWSGAKEWREIVQIGLILVDAGQSFSECDYIEFLVNPKCNPILSEYFIDLTGITQETLATQGKPLADRVDTLADFGTPMQTIIFNGCDGEIFRENCIWNSIDLPWPQERLFDFRPLLSKTLMQPEDKLISSELPNLAGVDFPGQAHSALHDCRAIAAALSAWRTAGQL